MSKSIKEDSYKQVYLIPGHDPLPRLLLEYMPDAEFQIWLQRISKAVILCMVSCVGLIMLCQWIPALQNALYSFFRWVLIPIKPLLIAKPSAAIAGLVSLLTTLTTFGNI